MSKCTKAVHFEIPSKPESRVTHKLCDLVTIVCVFYDEDQETATIELRPASAPVKVGSEIGPPCTQSPDLLCRGDTGPPPYVEYCGYPSLVPYGIIPLRRRHCQEVHPRYPCLGHRWNVGRFARCASISVAGRQHGHPLVDLRTLAPPTHQRGNLRVRWQWNLCGHLLLVPAPAQGPDVQ